MSDFRNDPNFVRHEMSDYDSRVQWAAVAVILLLVGGMILAAAYTGGDTQTAMNSPAVETTGPAAPRGPTPTSPPNPRKPRPNSPR
jgi:hypothetical protein